ncbi:ABC transporter permease [Saccharicrinis sp. FJH2]|uniref:ABC transporter permease n=1 Tax=Saccharicrinis sp. FJH65 TaxID=3344659 RepID=UPI0035F2B4E3
MLRFKIKLAFRNLLKNKLYSILIIGGFSIGFTVCILIGLYYNAEHNVNANFPGYKNIYRVYDVNRNRFNLDYKLYPTLAQHYSQVEAVCPMEYSSGFPITIQDAESNAYTRVDQIISTSNSFFSIFSIDILQRSSDLPFNTINSLAISESVAKRMYGDQNPLGRTIKHERFTGVISAVIKDLPENSSFKAELLLNCENKAFQISQECADGKCIYPTNLIVKLNPTADADEFTQTLNSTIDDYNANTDSLSLQNLSDIYLSPLSAKDAHSKGNSRMLIVFLSIAILILILSSINYLNYTISVQYAKFREIGINKTSGAGRKELLLDSLIEVSMGIIISLALALLFTILLMPYTKVIFGREILPSDINFSQIIPVFMGLLAGIVVINSLAPIYVISRFSITEFLSGSRKRTGKMFGKQVMLTFQLAVSIALITGVIMIFKQLNYVKNYDLGFNEKHLVRLELPYQYEHQDLIRESMIKLPFVTDATLSDGHPGWIKLRMGSGDDQKPFIMNCVHVSNDFLKTMDIHLKEGRNFLPGDKKKACIMNEAAIKAYGWENIENKKYNNGDGYDVVGVVDNFNVASLYAAVQPLMLIYAPDYRFGSLSLRLVPGNTGQQMAQIKQVWNTLLKDVPMEFSFYDLQFEAMYKKDDKLAQSVTFFSLVAIILTCMGILGQIFLISLNRTKEIGVRKVNGAKISEIMILLNKDLLLWVTLAFVIASPIAWYFIHKWLENFAYKTTLSWWIFALSGILALGIALLTVSWQSWKAATRNPVEALRYE